MSQALSNATLPPSLAPLNSRNPLTSTQSTPPKKVPKSEDGTRESPIALYSDADEDKAMSNGVKRKLESHVLISHGSEGANGSTKKKRKTIEIVSSVYPFRLYPY